MAKKISTARKVGRVIKTVLKTLLVIILVAAIAGVNTILPTYARMINDMLGYEQSWDNSNAQTDGLDLDYYKADYTADTIGDAMEDLGQRIAGEGTVLLKNDDAALPLASGTTLSLFGESGAHLGGGLAAAVLGGGSGSYDDLNAALEAEGFQVNQTLEDFYTEGAGKDYVLGTGSISYGDSEDFSINECPLSELEAADGVLDSAQGTTPVFVLKRVAGEGRDAPRSMYNHASNPEDQARTYLEPDSTEREILQYLNDNYDDVILLVTTSQAMELDWVADYPSIKSVLFVPSFGEGSYAGLAGILSGRVNPSAKTVDTFAADTLASPAAQNFGDYQYVDADGNLTKYNYVTYEEGIYVGYKYYETRYEDAVLGQGNAGDFDYDAEVVYPFGYGLSYTTFDWSDFATSWDGTTCTATVTVTNTGDVAGKDVVELYAQSPYTDYDREMGVEKAAVQLVGYGKSEELQPGESQTVAVSFDESQLASFDTKGAGTYILEEGTYYVTAATDAHHAVNNVLAAKGADVDGDASFAATYEPDVTGVDSEKYAYDSNTGEKITTLFADAAGDATYLTRADWEGTFPTHDGEVSDQISTWGNEINGSDGKSYLYTKVASDELIAQLDSYDSGNPDVSGSFDDTPTYGADNGLTLADLRGADFDDERWELLLDQLTVDDYDVTINRAGYGSEYLTSVGKPFTIDADTAAGLIYGGAGSMLSGQVTFPNPMTVAQTWNQNIASEYGAMIGNEANLGGATGWYAPSMNIHRTPYSGRNGEYYSEDGFLSGTVGSLEIRGAAERGVYSFIKHFALNDQEDHRGDREGQFGAATWANEQSIREVYLKAFDMCMHAGTVEESYVESDGNGGYRMATREMPAAQAVMSSFNRIGATWTGGSYALITQLLRDEWGFDGWVITDAANDGVHMYAKQMIEAGADAKLTYLTNTGSVWTFESDNPEAYHYARQAMHRLLYTVANSRAMEGSMPGSVYVPGTQFTTKVTIGVDVIGAALIALVFWTGWRNHKKRQAERAEA